MRRSLTLTIALTAVFATGTVASASARVYVFDGGYQKLVYKPTSWAAGGVGASARMEKLRWSSGRTARGTAANNNCDPTCAEGSIIREPGSMSWSRPRMCTSPSGSRYRYYTRVRYRAGGHTTTFNWDPGDLSSDSCHR